MDIGVPKKSRSTRFGPVVTIATRRMNMARAGHVRTDEVRVISGNPDSARISTSYVERQNLSMRMGIGFSKKIENHAAAIAIH
jgi:hypothetical protein